MRDDTGPLETTEFPPAVLPAAHRHRRGPVITRCLLAGVAVLAVTVAAIVAVRVVHAPPAASPAPVRLYNWHLLTERNIAASEHQIRAAELHGHATTVRLQILQVEVVGADARRFRPQYLHYVRQLTSFGLRLGLTVVLSAQTEVSVGYAAGEPLPARTTYVLLFAAVASGASR